ncbi:MAG: spermidine synthase [Acidimicrobiales bacterium]
MSEAAEVSSTSSEHDGLLPARARLVALSFLMLFGELALIRWLGAHVFYLSYFSNFVLLGSFLGIGLGFLWAGRSSWSLYPLAPVLLGALVAYVYMFDVPLDVEMRDVIFFQSIKPSSALPREVVLALLFVSVAAVMAAIGDGIARTFSRFRPLDAYKWDLVGSVLGIVAFTALSFLGAQPVVWGLLMAAVFLATVPLRQPVRVGLAAAGCALIVLPMIAASQDSTVSDQERGFVPDAENKRLIWSPYYRITALDGPEGTSTFVNQTPHWHQFDTEGSALYEGIYDLVAEPEGGDVLVIGAGSGNDVAAALNRDADHVDAVEIDPRLMELAQDNHPEAPYDDPRVDVHVDDGRAYLERSSHDWDRILLGLPDSLTLVPGQSSVRLESYLFTREAMESARDHLAPGGVFAMYNWYRQDWLIDRYAATLASVFDQPPCVTRLGEQDNLAILAASDDADALDCSAGETWQAAADAPEPVSDDHPFPYLQTRSVPGLYVWSGLLVLVLSLGAVAGISLIGRPNKAASLREVAGYADLFFMGVAFMLLETKSVVQFALLFGTTWLVNALVFLGVLCSVLVAVAVSRRVTFRRPVRLYGVLLAALALAYVIPPDRLLDLDVVPRFLAAVTLSFFPIFTANLVFTQRFKDTAHSTVAFGANLIGAMVGGLLEYAALITGYRNLLVIVALAYGLAFLTGRERLVGGPEPDEVEVGPEPPVGEPVPA